MKMTTKWPVSNIVFAILNAIVYTAWIGVARVEDSVFAYCVFSAITLWWITVATVSLDCRFKMMKRTQTLEYKNEK